MATAEDAPIPRWTLAGTAFLGGAASAILSALPATLRVEDAGAVWNRWIALAACAVLPATALVLVFRGARRGLASFAGPGTLARMTALVSWGLSLLVLFTAFGAMLRQKTHHHGLAGVTFAIGALLAGLVLAVMWARVATILARRSLNVQRLALAGTTLVTLLFFLALGTSLARGAAEGRTSPLGACVIDLLAIMITAGLGSRPEITRSRWLAILGPPLAIAIMVLGVVVVRAELVSAYAFSRAPAHVWLIAVMAP